ncbi:MAG: DUF4910 domain-containing protein, partial [Bacteroidota bacterium]
CMSHRQLEQLEAGTYEVLIDSTLAPGSLSYGEYYLPGETSDEILLTAHICHPSLANDNLSGIGVLTYLAKALQTRNCRYSYRFLFIPGTIGSITWLAHHRNELHNIRGGLVASLLGDAGAFTYKKSRRGDTELDRLVTQLLRDSGAPHRVIDFFPYGYDERQFCSPGFNLPVGNLTRSQYGAYPEYHTSADDLNLITAENLEGAYELYLKIVEGLEANRRYLNRFPYGEPQLGRRGLYDAIGGDSDSKELQMAMLWILNLSDGGNSLLDIAERSGCRFELIEKMATILTEKGLLQEVGEQVSVNQK